MKKSKLAVIIAALFFGPTIAQAQSSFTIRVPVTTLNFVPVNLSYNFGNVLIGGTPQHQFTFTNAGSAPTTISAVTPTGNAQVVSTNCVGTLAASQSCTILGALSVTGSGPTSGTITVSHSVTATPNLYTMTATGVSSDVSLVSKEAMLDFGSTSVRTPVGPLVAHLENTGSTPVDILDVATSDSSPNYVIDGSGCMTTLEAGQSCDIDVTFNPQYLGVLQSRIAVTLGDGTLINTTSLKGTAAQGTPSWSASQLNFLDVPVGTTSSQSVTLTNTGMGVLFISQLSVSGDASFSLSANNCGASLAPGASCDMTVSQTPPDSSIRSAVLQLDSTNSSLLTSRIQLYSRPISSRAVLSVSPVSLSFGDVQVGQPKSLTLSIKSTGNLPATVSSYALSGVNSADFSILNSTSCVGTLDPGNQCDLQVQANPSVLGAELASISLAADTPDPVPAVPLSVNGIAGRLNASPAVLSFGNVTQGGSATLTTTISNAGTAPATIGTIGSTAASAAGFSFSGCSGTSLAVGDNCQLTVTYAPSAVGTNSVTVSVPSDAVPNSLNLSLSGTGVAPVLPQGSLGAFACPTAVMSGSTFTCVGTLSNTGTVALPITGQPTRSNTAFNAPTYTCPASLPVGGTCQVSITGQFAAGRYTTTVSVPTGAGALSNSVSATVSDPQATLTTTAHGIVQTGQTNTATHTVINTGLFPVTLTLPPTLGVVSQPAGSTNNRFSVTSTTCSASLPAGGSCQISTQFAPDVAGTYQDTLSLPVSAGSWTTTLSQPLAGTGSLPPATGSDLAATPNPVSWGNVKVSASASQSFTLKNNGASSLSISALSLGGSNATDFAITSNNCVTTLASGASCLVAVNVRPSVTGARQAQIAITSSVSGVAPVALQATGVVGALSSSATTVAFGSTYVGTPVSKVLTFTNTGAASVVMGGMPTYTGANPAVFSVTTSTCTNATLAPGSACSLTLQYAPTSVADASANLHVTSDAGVGYVDIPVTGSGLAAPVGVPLLSAPSCTTPLQIGQAGSCTATFSNAGTAALTFQGVSATLGTASSNCPASMAVGASCTVSVSLPVFASAGSQSSTITVANSAGAVSKTAAFSVVAPSVSLATTNHGAVQVGGTNTASHTVTNMGSGSVTVTAATVSPSGPITLLSSGCGTLAPGASCQITTSCAPTAAGTFSANLALSVAGANPVGAVTCQGQAPSGTISSLGGFSSDVGGYSLSGNWFKVQNTGVGPLTIQGFYPASTDWTLYSDTANTGHCSLNKVLQAGQQCLIMEILTTGAPNKVFGGTQRIRTTAGDLTWASSMKTYGLALQPTTPFGTTAQAGDTVSASYTVVNQAPWPVANVAPTVTGTNYSLTGSTCGSLPPNGTCTVNVQLIAPSTAGTFNGSLTVNGAYPQIINGSSNPSVSSGVQGNATFSVTTVAPNVTVKLNAPPAARLGGYTDVTATVDNLGVGAVTLSPVPYVTSGTAYSVVGTTCGATLAAGAKCDVTVRFSPVTGSVNTANLFVRYSGVLTAVALQGVIVPTSDVVVTTKGPAEVGTSSSASYVINAANGGGGPATVQLSYAVSALNGATVQSVGTPTCNVTCTIDTVSSRVTATLQAGASLQVTLPVTVGSTLGAVQVNANALVTGVYDPNTSNNAASIVSQVVTPYIMVGDPADLGVCNNYSAFNAIWGYNPGAPRQMTTSESSALRTYGRALFCIPIRNVGVAAGVKLFDAEVTLTGYASNVTVIKPFLTSGSTYYLSPTTNASTANPSSWTRVIPGYAVGAAFIADSYVDVQWTPDGKSYTGKSISIKLTPSHPAVQIYKAESAVSCGSTGTASCYYTK